MTIELKKAKWQGDTCYTWRDPQGKLWRFYESRSRRLWHFMREDHDVSSIGYLTRNDAVAALERTMKED